MFQGFLDTIVARATPLGTSGICVIRVSGADACRLVDCVVRTDRVGKVSDLPPRYLASCSILIDGELFDRGLVVRFASPASYTGEDVVELHLHGNMLIADRTIRALCAAGARVASAGEFTRRAFVNGKMDLTQVEALGDHLAAETDRGVVVSQLQLRGVLRGRLEQFRERVIALLSRLELELDFVEEGYSFSNPEELAGLLTELRQFAESLVEAYESSVRMRRGPRVLLLGRPNAGKSSFFNAVVGFERALVSVVAGTTRDYIEEKVLHAGHLFSLIDSAGVHSSSDELESSGIERSMSLIPECDLVLYLIEGIGDLHVGSELFTVAELKHRFPDVVVLPVLTKSDLGLVPSSVVLESPVSVCSVLLPGSMGPVLDCIVQSLHSDVSSLDVLVTTRQRDVMVRLLGLLEEVEGSLASGSEVFSAELRRVLGPLGELTGEVLNDDVLAAVFSGFCIGK